MKIEMTPIGYVKNERKEATDDQWEAVISKIILAENIMEESLEGIEAFSHLEVIFYMDKVSDEKAKAQHRHPRNNPELPKLGTFAQRNKNRPNKIGLTTVELLERNSRTLKVKRLDAIDGTPILDIKPVMKEFEPKGDIRQPAWTQVIMKNYWK